MKVHPWMIQYGWRKLKGLFSPSPAGPVHLFFSICDHYEPLWNNANIETGLTRVQRWLNEYPKIAKRFRDFSGNPPKYTFFYPEEEYREEYLCLLEDICRRGYGEVEIHLHHDNDTSAELRTKLMRFKDTLANKHGLLSRHRETGEISYGFIHGNWALDNSSPDGKWCGVNDEISILEETGCYADFSMPSAPHRTQTTKINSVYYAIDDPLKPKSHDSGSDARAGKTDQQGLLMVQGPLMFNWRGRKWGILPRIENGSIGCTDPVSPDRMRLWRGADVHVKDRENYIFIKLHTHGCQERNSNYLLSQGGLEKLFSLLQEHCNDNRKYRLHYVSARESVNIIRALEDNYGIEDFGKMKDYLFKRITDSFTET
jgi:hypothetical protein